MCDSEQRAKNNANASHNYIRDTQERISPAHDRARGNDDLLGAAILRDGEFYQKLAPLNIFLANLLFGFTHGS